jgi:hypothetical protein
VNKRRQKLSLVSGSGSEFIGGVCHNDVSLAGCLKRYFTELFPEEPYPAIHSLQVPDSRIYYQKGELSHRKNIHLSDNLWIERDYGVVSHH